MSRRSGYLTQLQWSARMRWVSAGSMYNFCHHRVNIHPHVCCIIVCQNHICVYIMVERGIAILQTDLRHLMKKVFWEDFANSSFVQHAEDIFGR